MYWNLIWKFPGFVPFGANLTHFGAKPTIPEQKSSLVTFIHTWVSISGPYLIPLHQHPKLCWFEYRVTLGGLDKKPNLNCSQLQLLFKVRNIDFPRPPPSPPPLFAIHVHVCSYFLSFTHSLVRLSIHASPCWLFALLDQSMTRIFNQGCQILTQSGSEWH